MLQVSLFLRHAFKPYFCCHLQVGIFFWSKYELNLFEGNLKDFENSNVLGKKTHLAYSSCQRSTSISGESWRNNCNWIARWENNMLTEFSYRAQQMKSACTLYWTVKSKKKSCFKGSVSRDFRPPFFVHDSNPSRPLINRLKYFRIRCRFRRDIRSQSSKNLTPQCASHRGVLAIQIFFFKPFLSW